MVGWLMYWSHHMVGRSVYKHHHMVGRLVNLSMSEYLLNELVLTIAVKLGIQEQHECTFFLLPTSIFFSLEMTS